MKTMSRYAVLGLAFLSLTAARLHAAPTDDQIKRAISDARSYLRASFKNGMGSNSAVGKISSATDGASALAGIAMLEAGIGPDDPTIVAIAHVVRESAVQQTATYNLALDIIFLDKLGEPADVPLIQSCGIRLLAGQNRNGAWSYTCPGASDAEANNLLRGAVVAANKAPAKKEAQDHAGADPKDRPGLSKEAEDLRGRLVNNMNPAGLQGVPSNTGIQEDNSNTQFAVLGLWVARRYGVPTEKALEFAEARFRKLQSADGSWGYLSEDRGGSPAMTCAGLLALAAGRGVHTEQQRIMRSGGSGADTGSKPGKDNAKGSAPPAFRPMEDKQIVAALNYVGAAIAQDMAGGMPFGPGVANMPPQAAQMMGSYMGGQMLRNFHYGLWSIERVGMIFLLNKIGNADWYAWGSTNLVKSQTKNGSWEGGRYGPDIDTSFGLMFLCKANLVKDMSDLMGNRVLRANAKAATPKPAPGSATGEGPKIVEGTTPAAAPAADSEAQKLAKALVEATGAKQLEMIKEYAAAKGASYTEAFIEAIPQLPENAKKTARESFAERMSRMSANTLKSRLPHKSPEMRRAAILAVAMREEKELIPEVIASLEDPEELVWRAAHLALRSLSGKDFGPAAGASPDVRAKAAAAWKEWAKTQK